MQQYLDLYNGYRDLIDRNSAPVLNAQRAQAAETLKQTGLDKPMKDFTPTDPSSMLSTDYAINLARHEVPVTRSNLFTCSVPELSTQVWYLVNEQLLPRPDDDRLPEGVYAGSLRDFALQHPDLAERYYNKLASQDVPQCHPGVSALNTMFCQDGFVLYVPDGMQIEKPFQLISLLRSVEDFMAAQRILIILGDGAKANVLVCDHDNELRLHEGDALPTLLSLQVAEIYVGKNAQFDYYCLEEHHDNARRLSQIYVSQGEGSNAAIGQFSLTAGTTRNHVHISLDGEHIDTQLFGMVIADRKQKVDNLTFIDHRHPNCTSNELFKYVLDEEAQGSFLGRILVREGAVGTDAHQTDRNLCLTPQAHMLARPELEIYADDVKCSHGATVGQLDPAALFYMRTRGIQEEEARMLLMFAFMSDVIEKIRILPLQDRLRHLVEKRFRGELGTAASCQNCG